MSSHLRYAPLLYLGGRLINFGNLKAIRDIGITHSNESKVGYYVGLMAR
jgi:hypothetical protein